MANTLVPLVDRDLRSKEAVPANYLADANVEAAVERRSRRCVGVDALVIVRRAKIVVEDADSKGRHS